MCEVAGKALSRVTFIILGINLLKRNYFTTVRTKLIGKSLKAVVAFYHHLYCDIV